MEGEVLPTVSHLTGPEEAELKDNTALSYGNGPRIGERDDKEGGGQDSPVVVERDCS